MHYKRRYVYTNINGRLRWPTTHLCSAGPLQKNKTRKANTPTRTHMHASQGALRTSPTKRTVDTIPSAREKDLVQDEITTKTRRNLSNDGNRGDTTMYCRTRHGNYINGSQTTRSLNPLNPWTRQSRPTHGNPYTRQAAWVPIPGSQSWARRGGTPTHHSDPYPGRGRYCKRKGRTHTLENALQPMPRKHSPKK